MKHLSLSYFITKITKEKLFVPNIQNLHDASSLHLARGILQPTSLINL